VVANLLTNAARYTEPGGLISILLSVVHADGAAQAVLKVRDTGRGIPKDMLDKVFDMFVQVQQTIDRSMGGLGLGLTLVKRLVEMHDGTVSAQSDGPGKGSEFVVRLPLAVTQRAAPESVRVSTAADEPAMRRIVLVEDSEDIREAVREYLQQLGHEVTVAANGLDGVAKVLEVLPDIAFIDVGLPGIDGYEVARRIRTRPDGKSLYLVALTGYGGPEAKKMAVEAGFDLHLTKPVDVAELPQVVSSTKKRRPRANES
jgi:CheY-like chemotaxis protein/anti-sigma regulatory factor (Ser/Thr protein kinase)